MKKFIFILALVFIIIGTATGQTVDRNLYLNNDATYGNLSLTAADAITNTDQIYIIQIEGKHNERATQDFKIKLSKVSGDPDISVQLQGMKFTGDTPTSIGDAIVWKATTADTTFIISNATLNSYRYYQVYFDATAVAQSSTIDTFKAKLYLN